MQLILIFGIAIAIGAVVFALQNNLPVMVTLAFWTFEGSLAMVLLVAVGVGALSAGLLSSPTVIRGQWAIGRMRSQIADLERKLAAQLQRNQDLSAELERYAPQPDATTPEKEKPYVGLRALMAGSAEPTDAPQTMPPADKTS